MQEQKAVRKELDSRCKTKKRKYFLT